MLTNSLFQAFKAIFISPTSTDVVENESLATSSGTKHRRGDRRTRTGVAKVIGMQTVQPRAIAYVACQVSGSPTVDIDFDAS